MTARVPRWRWSEPLAPVRELLARGGVLAIPTESSYGLAVHPESAAGVAAVYRVKGRQADKPLPVVVADLDQIRDLGGDPAPALASGLAGLWPAPLTLLLPLARPVAAASGSARLGFRIPAHPLLCGLLSELGHGLTATSANRSGEAPILDPGDLTRLLVRWDALVVDGGRLPGGPPSTIVGFGPGGAEIVRQGRFRLDRLESAAVVHPEGGGTGREGSNG